MNFSSLGRFSRIAVTGPARSGTRIAAKIIATELGYDYVDEETFGFWNASRFVETVESKDKVVVHCPTMARVIHNLCRRWIESPLLVVFMRRDVDDIIKSRKKLGWSSDKCEHATIIYDFWEQQQHELIENCIELEYESLASHRLWIPKRLRGDFDWNQTELKEAPGEPERDMIPKRIFTIWLNENGEWPEMVRKCVATHTLPGYEHRMITLDNCYKGSEYVRGCLETKNWVKAADFLRMHYLYIEGGIYLDADMEVIKDFDDLLNARIFCCKENNGFIANSVVGAEPQHPIVGEYLNRVERNFKGTGDMVFEAGMRIWTDVVYQADREAFGVKIYEPDYFLPFDHQTGATEVTENTRTYHHFMKLWMKG